MTPSWKDERVSLYVNLASRPQPSVIPIRGFSYLLGLWLPQQTQQNSWSSGKCLSDHIYPADIAQTYLQPNYGNGVFSNDYLSAEHG